MSPDKNQSLDLVYAVATGTLNLPIDSTKCEPQLSENGEAYSIIYC